MARKERKNEWTNNRKPNSVSVSVTPKRGPTSRDKEVLHPPSWIPRSKASCYESNRVKLNSLSFQHDSLRIRQPSNRGLTQGEICGVSFVFIAISREIFRRFESHFLGTHLFRPWLKLHLALKTLTYFH